MVSSLLHFTVYSHCLCVTAFSLTHNYLVWICLVESICGDQWRQLSFGRPDHEENCVHSTFISDGLVQLHGWVGLHGMATGYGSVAGAVLIVELFMVPQWGVTILVSSSSHEMHLDIDEPGEAASFAKLHAATTSRSKSVLRVVGGQISRKVWSCVVFLLSFRCVIVHVLGFWQVEAVKPLNWWQKHDTASSVWHSVVHHELQGIEQNNSLLFGKKKKNKH